MNARWNRAAGVSPKIRCALIEARPMSDSAPDEEADGFRDLVPWADPYIAALIEKLRRSARFDDRGPACELPPPLDSRDDRGDDRPGGWTPRNWPRD
jgi:hypothetical protein